MKGQDFLGTGSNRIKIYVADSFFTRLRGLIGHELAEDEGLLLISCNQIHSMFMSYPIDVLYLSEKRQVIRIARGMRPWSFGPRIKNCRFILEMKSGSAERYGLTEGVRLRFEEMEAENG
jgi:uncharacterized membrane protein (UPF0127 family)